MPVCPRAISAQDTNNCVVYMTLSDDRLYAAQDPSRARIASVAVTPRVGDSHVSQKLRWASSAPIRTASAVPGSSLGGELNEDVIDANEAGVAAARSSLRRRSMPRDGSCLFRSADRLHEQRESGRPITRHAGPLGDRDGGTAACAQRHTALLGQHTSMPRRLRPTQRRRRDSICQPRRHCLRG